MKGTHSSSEGSALGGNLLGSALGGTLLGIALGGTLLGIALLSLSIVSPISRSTRSATLNGSSEDGEDEEEE
jgi:hypothetical protein